MSVGARPLLPRLWRRPSAWLFLLRGLAQTVGGRPAEAERAYRESLLRHPGSETAWLMLARSVEKQGR